MATYKSITSGNFTSASTWGSVVGVENTETNIQLLTTSSVGSPNFLSSGETINGILVKYGAVVATPTQISGTTIVAELFNVTTSTIIQTSQILVSDLNNNGTNSIPSPYATGYWVHFKFPSNITLTSGQNYSIRLRIGVNNGGAYYFFINAANAWNRGYVTTTNAVPTTNDIIIVCGEHPSSSVTNTISVVMNNTATTTFGNVYVSDKGILTYGTANSTNYYLKLAGNLIIAFDGLFEMGKSAAPIPSSSNASLEFVCSSGGQYGITAFSDMTTYGNQKTTRTTLASSIPAGVISLSTSNTTNWSVNDGIVVAGTSKTYTDSQQVTITGGTGTTLNFTPAITTSHSGATPYVADIINLTRNVKIFGNSTTNTTYIYIPQSNIGSTINLNYTEIYFLGTNAVNKYGIITYSYTANISIQYCSIYNTGAGSTAFGITPVSSVISITGILNFSNNVLWNLSQTVIQGAFYVSAILGSWTFSNNCIIRGGVQLFDVGGVFTNNVIANQNFTAHMAISEIATINSISGNTFYGSNLNAILVTDAVGMISSSTFFNINGDSIRRLPSTTTTNTPFIVDGITCNACGSGLLFLTPNHYNRFVLNNGVFNNGMYGLFYNGGIESFIVSNCIFSGSSVADIFSNSISTVNTIFNNCKFMSSVELFGQNTLLPKFTSIGLSSLNHQQINGANKSYDRFGTIQSDYSLFNTSAPSMRLTPINSSFKLCHHTHKLAVKSGDTLSVSVNVRKSVVGDGTAYNGNQPRLLVRYNPIANIGTIDLNLDYVLDTATNLANGSWQTLIGTIPSVANDCVLEFFIDCDGTLGWINIDDWSTSYYQDTRGTKFWYADSPLIELDSTPKERSYTFIN